MDQKQLVNIKEVVPVSSVSVEQPNDKNTSEISFVACMRYATLEHPGYPPAPSEKIISFRRNVAVSMYCLLCYYYCMWPHNTSGPSPASSCSSDLSSPDEYERGGPI